jgi:hypothetical protein
MPMQQANLFGLLPVGAPRAAGQVGNLGVSRIVDGMQNAFVIAQKQGHLSEPPKVLWFRQRTQSRT